MVRTLVYRQVSVPLSAVPIVALPSNPGRVGLILTSDPNGRYTLGLSASVALDRGFTMPPNAPPFTLDLPSFTGEVWAVASAGTVLFNAIEVYAA